MNTKPFASVDFRHSYFESGFFDGFQVIPTPQTNRFLTNHRARIKHHSNGFRLYIDVDESAKPLISVAQGTRLYFYLKLTNPDWPLFSNCSDLPASAYRLFTNVGNGAQDTELKVKTLDRPMAGDQFGLLEIEIGPSMILAANPHALQLSFSALSVLWEFFLVTNLSRVGDGFSLVDTQPQRSGEALEFRLVNPADTAAMPIQSRLKDQLLSRHPDAICLHYVSQQLINCRQQGFRHIRLLHNGSRLIDHVPNPDLKNISRFVPPGEQSNRFQESSFQIIKYITHSFSTSGH